MYCFKSFSWKKETHVGPTRGTLNVSTCVRRSDTDQVLKHERQALVGVDDVMKSDDICVLQVFQQRHYKIEVRDVNQVPTLRGEIKQLWELSRIHKRPVNRMRWGPAERFCTFSDGRAGRALLVLQPDLFQSDQVVG